MGGDGFVDPLTDGAEMIIGLTLQVRVVGMAQTQDQKCVKQQIETEH